MRRGLIEGGFESTAVKSGAINQLEALLSKLLFVLQTRGLGYRCILTRHSSESRACCAVSQVQRRWVLLSHIFQSDFMAYLTIQLFWFVKVVTHKENHGCRHVSTSPCVHVVHLQGMLKRENKGGFPVSKLVLSFLQNFSGWAFLPSSPLCVFPLGVDELCTH